MSDPNHRQRSDPALSQSYRYEDHSKSKGPREQSPYSRDTNRHDERQDNGDRVRTSRTHKNEHRCPEKTATQDTRHYRKEQVHDRPHEHKPRNGKETSRERHREDRSRQERHPENRSVDQKNENHDGNRVDKSRKQKYPEDRHFDREESSLGRQREERRLDQLELNLHKGEGSQKRYWEERSLDKHRVYSSHAVDRYWGDESPSIPRNSQEINFHQESSYDKRTVLPMSYGPHPQSPYFDEREYYESQPEGGVLDCNKCRYLCTGRGYSEKLGADPPFYSWNGRANEEYKQGLLGNPVLATFKACCQFVEVLLNMLILVCASVSYNSTGGFTGITNMGGIYYYAFGGAYSGFDGADGDTAQKLDVQFYQLKLPTVSATMAFGGALMGFSCLMVLIGVFRLPWHFPVWLLVECILDSLISCGYLPALYFYFRKLLDAYETQICKDRETLYKSKGYPGFSCALHGADIAAGLFGCMAIVAFALSAVLAVRGFRRVRHMKSLQQSKLEL